MAHTNPDAPALYAARDERRAKEREKYVALPSEMERPANIRIRRTHDGEAVSSGINLYEGPPLGGRKLEPDEVVTVDLAVPVFKHYLDKRSIEIVEEPATRPWVYDNDREAKMHRPVKMFDNMRNDRTAMTRLLAKMKEEVGRRNEDFDRIGGTGLGLGSQVPEAVLEALIKRRAPNTSKSLRKTDE